MLLNKPIDGLDLQGFAVGNPTSNIRDDFYYGTWKTWAVRGLISRPTWRLIKSACANVTEFLNPPQGCNDAITVAQTEMGNLFNPYDLSADMCVAEETNRLRSALFRQLGFPSPLPYLPCEDLFIQNYLNRPDVQTALHVVPNMTQSGWSDCVNDTRWNYDYSGFYISQLPVYERIVTSTSLKVIVYSGDADTVVPFVGTSRWIFNLLANETITEKWHSWVVPEAPGQAAGFTIQWNNLFRFITIRNAGHLVPQGVSWNFFCIYVYNLLKYISIPSKHSPFCKIYWEEALELNKQIVFGAGQFIYIGGINWPLLLLRAMTQKCSSSSICFSVEIS